MGEAIQHFWNDVDPFARKERSKYEALIRLLSPKPGTNTGEVGVSTNETVPLLNSPQETQGVLANTPSPQSIPLKGSKPISRPFAAPSVGVASSGSTSLVSKATLPQDFGTSQSSDNSKSLIVATLDDFIIDQIFLLHGGNPPDKHYENMRRLWTLCCDDSDELKLHPFVRSYRGTLREMLNRFTVILKPPSPSFQALPQAELVDTLISDHVIFMFAVMNTLVEKMGLTLDNVSPDLN
ncbi:hypothetical protein B0H34DRAFT_520757 [Crassisporium funariophilum]|nr:hypothetical protein B0H34DRAFT_520757 [Crassisporium funariophilum]